MAVSGDRSNGTLPRSKTSPAMTKIDRNSANMKMYAYEIKQNVSKKIIFAATNAAAIDGIAHRLLSCYHSQRLLFSHSKNNFSTNLTPPKKRYTHCRVFIVDSICSTTIDIITIFCFLFLNRRPMCKAGHTADGTNLQVSF